MRDFIGYARELGLDIAVFRHCVDSGAMADNVRDDFVAGLAAGVRGTPAFFINGQPISGAQPLEVFRQLIESSLEVTPHSVTTEP
jgi:predicted DsbA family dithiol-disulfide isomerase